MSKILVDTNILVYAIDEDSIYFKKARQILYEIDCELFTTSKNLSEFLSVVTRSPVNALSTIEAVNLVEDFFPIFKVLYPSSHSCFFLVNLLKKYQPVGLHIHDFEIASIGLASGINQIATFNQKDFNAIEEIEVVPPFSIDKSIIS